MCTKVAYLKEWTIIGRILFIINLIQIEKSWNLELIYTLENIYD